VSSISAGHSPLSATTCDLALACGRPGAGGPEELPRNKIAAKAKELEQKDNICAGAWRPYRHSHFFTSEGGFGSLDENLQRVDDGHYKVVGNTLVFGLNRFRYRVVHGDTLTLDPIITSAMRREALAHPWKFTDAVWMVSVAYAGTTWKRVPCEGWC
jgi:hypothetical protein